jgi:hypothetical protein
MISVVTALWAVVARVNVERANNTVGIMVDYYSTKQLASDSGKPMLEVLRALRTTGVWGVGLEELTVEQAAHEGLLMLMDGWEAGPALQAMGMGTVTVNDSSEYLVWWPDTTPQWLVRSLRLHIEPWTHTVVSKDGLVVWEIAAARPYVGDANAPVSAASLRKVGLGLSENAVRLIRQAGWL